MSGFDKNGVRTTGIAPDTWIPQPQIAGTGERASVPTLPPIITDLSHWDWPTFDAQCFKDAGVTHAIVGCQDEVIAKAMVGQLEAVGIAVPWLYAFLYFGGQQPMSATQRMIRVQNANPGRARVLCCDAEADDPDVPNVTVATRNAQLANCLAAVKDAGHARAIYTAAWWWVPKHANSPGWKELPLWNANYGANDGTLGPIRNVNFGGWTDVAIHQYTSTGGFCGRDERDRNHVFVDAPGFGPQGGSMTTFEEDLLLSVYSGAEEKDLTRAERLVNAEFRMRQRADAIARGVADVAHGVEFHFGEHQKNHNGALLPPHTHTLDGQTGGITSR
jgi:hypothetical protein